MDDGLSQLIDAIRARIEKHRSTYESNESDVARTLVEPVLEYLGWNLLDVDEVKTQAPTDEKKKPDYLLRKDGQDKLIVEVKKLNGISESSLLRDILQLSTYCTSLGVLFGILTDGAVWILFKAFEEGVKGRDKVVWRIDLRKDQPPPTKLLQISKERTSELEMLKVQYLTFEEVWEQLMKSPRDLIDGLAPVLQRFLESGEGKSAFRPADVQEFLNEKVYLLVEAWNRCGGGPILDPRLEPKPTSRRMMEIAGQAFAIGKSKDIILNTAEWCIKHGHLTYRNVPIQLGPTRYLVNDSKKNPNNKTMISPKKLSNGLYIETNASSPDCERWARKLLKACSLDDAILRVTESDDGQQ